MYTYFHSAFLKGLVLMALMSNPVSVLTGPAHPGCGAAAPSEKTNVEVTQRREGDVTRIFVHNKERCEITMTFDYNTVNLESEVNFPHTATFPANQVTEAFTLRPADEATKWEYSFTNHFKMGSHVAEHNDAVLYELPYRSGATFRVTQAYGGSYSHKGANQYAIDWQMPEGTPVCAARGGVVVKLKQLSNQGGPSMSFDKYNNYVLIRHDDGTLGHYCHLQQNSVNVRLGDVVTEGQQIARSGNTGFSSGPHLHFAVFKTRNGKERVTVPVKFRAEGNKAITLVSGRRYRSMAPMMDAPALASRETAQQNGTGSGS